MRVAAHGDERTSGVAALCHMLRPLSAFPTLTNVPAWDAGEFNCAQLRRSNIPGCTRTGLGPFLTRCQETG